MLAVSEGLTRGRAQLWQGTLPVHEGNIFVRGPSPSPARAVICGLPELLERRAPLDIDPSVPSSISRGYLIGLGAA